jgi:CBS domain-containing protein
MLQVRDVMTKDVLTVSPEHSLREAMALLAAHGVSGAPVLAGHQVVGVVSGTDLIEFAAALPPLGETESQRLDVPQDVEEPGVLPEDDEWDADDDDEDAREALWFLREWRSESAAEDDRITDAGGVTWSALDEHLVREVMTEHVVSVRGTMPLAAAADLMRRRHLHRVLVMENDRLVGIMSSTDIVAAVADGRIARTRWVFETKPVADE